MLMCSIASDDAAHLDVRSCRTAPGPHWSLSMSTNDRMRFAPWALAACASLIAACGSGGGGGGSNGGGSAPPTPVYSYQPPSSTGDGWQVADARAQGVDVATLEDLVSRIRASEDGFRYIDSLLIAKNGNLVLDERFRQRLDFSDEIAGNTDVNRHLIFSATKSFASTLVGIAIDRGYIAGVDAPVHDYFAHKQPIANWNEAKASITVQDWLTMRHGYDWDEWSLSYFDSNSINAQMAASSDPLQFLLDRPMANQPGEAFAYSTGVSYGLGELVEAASGQELSAFLEANLLAPLNIRDYTYVALGEQLHIGTGLYLSTRDMAKLGQLYLDEGIWNGTRVVSQQWVDEATTARVDADWRSYGYHWWIRTFQVGADEYQTYNAHGIGGQYVFVLPALNTIVAMTGSAYDDDELAQVDLDRIMEEFILPAVR